MAAIAHLQGEEKVGLGIAVVAHIALFGLLLWHANRAPPAIPPTERMTVSLATDVSLESTAPEPSLDSQAAVAPEISPEPEPVPAPVTEPVPPPQPRTIASPTPAPPKSKPTTPPKPKPTASSKLGGGARLGDDFLKGVSAGERSGSGSPAAKFGPAEQASLEQAINRQLKKYWQAPQGPDAELLVTYLAFDLNSDGSLAGSPRVVRQEGITPTNEAQAARHAEQAVRAVRLAAPFDLPDEFYDKWKRVKSWRFDRKLG
ncbi:energy transducer TonB [Altererythrobacter salegens]|uniref:Energy transducer TonB n=1 Tax=Croceibacterium salegens TaxID=1737568 RepID=A0A6I4SQU0_9SPHN|nr:energy transducer TonB [Croceibacterium salegens]MXO58194.1 energy transducer TonB [Croceibacterium salegens]